MLVHRAMVLHVVLLFAELRSTTGGVVFQESSCWDGIGQSLCEESFLELV